MKHRKKQLVYTSFEQWKSLNLPKDNIDLGAKATSQKIAKDKLESERQDNKEGSEDE